jgi:FG-GAP-like repeat
MSSSQNYVSIFLGNGDGTFPGPVNYTAGSQPMSIVAADFDRDGSVILQYLTAQTCQFCWAMGMEPSRLIRTMLRGISK